MSLEQTPSQKPGRSGRIAVVLLVAFCVLLALVFIGSAINAESLRPLVPTLTPTSGAFTGFSHL
ncbi:MAG: hypothetical protein MUD01_04530 [Chloroflexaceae bacterium]|jgi:hypothetical protein|nr:hypothetical protein [Chloroflexaceae bacterium]